MNIINKIFGGVDDETVANLCFTNYLITFKNQTINIDNYPELKKLGFISNGICWKITHSNMSIDELANKICEITGLSKEDIEINRPFKLL